MKDIQSSNKESNNKLELNDKIAEEFNLKSNEFFIESRAKLWDKLMIEKEENSKREKKEQIKIILKEGKIIDGISNVTTPYSIAQSNLKKSILKEIIVAKVIYLKKVSNIEITSLEEPEQEENCSNKEKENFELWDMNRPLIGDCKIEFCNFDTMEGKKIYWHSSAHLLASVIEKFYCAKICNGNSFQEGFFYDSYMGNFAIDPSKDFSSIEKQIKIIIKQNFPFTRLVLNKKQALSLFEDNKFKKDLILNRLKEDELTTAYRCGDFIDLCLGPHIPNLNMIKSLKIIKNSATNWLGIVTNDSLQRIYGISFPNEKLLKEYLKKKEEEEKRDHRYIGKQQNLFMFHNLSPGSCFWFGPGTYIYNKLLSFLRNQYNIREYIEVITPNIYNLKLWKISGHYRKFKDNMFLMKVENQGFGLKPVNCPTACLIFDSTVRSYRDLPIRIADFGVLHRNDISGAITGLTRAKRFEMDDTHIFCRYDQIMDEVIKFLDFMSYVYDIFGLKYELFLSTRSPKMTIGNIKLWDMAEKSLIEALNKFGKPWKFNPGKSAFYGPKIDITLIDSLGRKFKCSSTLQLDFQLPIRFNLMYKNENNTLKNKEEKLYENNLSNSKEVKEIDIFQKDEWDEEFKWEEKPLKPGFSRPCIIHRAIFFSIERFTAILIEHFGGKLPFWLSPRQICICTVNNKVQDYAEKWYLMLNYRGYQVFLDKSSNTLQKKIRNAQINEYKYIGVIGKEEVEGNSIDIRSCEGQRIGKYTLNKLINFFQSLEPRKSKEEINLLEKIYNNIKLNELEYNEEKLKLNLYLNGDECSNEDIALYEKLKNIEIDKDLLPNLFKWKKLMNLK